MDKDCISTVSGRTLQEHSNHKEVNLQEVLELRKSKLPSTATVEGGKNDTSKNYLFNTRFPLSSTWLCAVKNLDSSPQLYSQICSKDLAASVLYTQGRGKKGFHHFKACLWFCPFFPHPHPQCMQHLPAQPGTFLPHFVPSVFIH